MQFNIPHTYIIFKTYL